MMIKLLEIVMVNLGFTINNSKFSKFSQKMIDLYLCGKMQKLWKKQWEIE